MRRHCRSMKEVSIICKIPTNSALLSPWQTLEISMDRHFFHYSFFLAIQICEKLIELSERLDNEAKIDIEYNVLHKENSGLERLCKNWGM